MGRSAPKRGRLALWMTTILSVLLGVSTIQAQEVAEPVQADSSIQSAPLLDPDRGLSSPMSRAPYSAEIPDVYLTQCRIDADVQSDRVNLEILVEVAVHRGEGWRRTPLRLGQAHIWKREYEGPGEEAPDLSASTPEEGVTWLLKGVGKHRLKLYGWTPLRRSISGGQFQLSLPPLPPQFETRLNVRIPEANALVRPARNLTVLQTQRGNQQTIVDASVVGNRLDFAWQTSVSQGETATLVLTHLHLRPAAERVSLIAEQTLELPQSGVEELLVRLPTDFRLIQLDGPQYRSHEPLADRQNWVRVRLNPGSSSRVDLHWVLEQDLVPQGGVLRLDGFQVEGAAREEGIIRIDEFENFRVVPRPAELESVHRIGVNQVRGMGAGAPLTAYEFLKQPFELAFDLQPLAPQFSVAPHYKLLFHENELELRVRYGMQFDRGSVSELLMDWPGWRNERWRVQSASIDQPQAGPVSVDYTSAPGKLRLWWPEPVDRNSTATIVFRRPLQQMELAEIKFTLPVPQAPHRGEAQFEVQADDQLEVRIQTEDGTSLEQALTANDAGATVAQAPMLLRMEQISTPMLAQVDVHQREVAATTTIGIREVSSTQLEVDQFIHLDVKYGRLERLYLIPPDLGVPEIALPESIDVSLNDRRLPLQFEADSLVAVLPTPSKGALNLRVAYRFPLESGTSSGRVNLPIVQLEDIPFTRGQCLIEAIDLVQVRNREEGWEAVRTSPRGALWINPLEGRELTHLPLTIGRQLAESSQQYSVNQIQLRVLLSADGSADCWSEFQLNQPQSRVVIQFPADAEFKSYELDGVPLSSSAVTHSTTAKGEVTLTLPADVRIKPKLAVRYRLPRTGSFGLTHRQRIPLPQFFKSVWVEEKILEVRLPEGHLLLMSPLLEPQFQWVRRLLMWRREPTSSYLKNRTMNAPPAFQFPVGTFYAFRGYGSANEVSFRSMNRSLIVLIGAGFSLLLGFMFWRFPQTRNIYSLMVLSFLFAFASLWYLEPILVLLQPAALGVLLALTATVADSSSRRNGAPLSHSRQAPFRRPPVREPTSSANVSTRIYQPVTTGRPDNGEG